MNESIRYALATMAAAGLTVWWTCNYHDGVEVALTVVWLFISFGLFLLFLDSLEG